MDDSMELLLSNRRFLYALLARAFASEPDGTLLGVVMDEHTGDECALLDDEDGAGRRLWRMLADEAAADEDDRLRSEYTRLFLGPEKLPAPPWESVYVNGEPLLFQESTLVVRETYRRSGYASAGYPREADDHVAIELDFMAALAVKTCEAMDRDALEAQRSFLEKHLLVWIESFAERLGSCDTVSGFYPSFARLAALVCRRDAEVLKELLTA